MRKVAVAVLFLIFVGFGIGLYHSIWLPRFARNDSDGKPVIKIGVIAPLTGDAAETAENIKVGVELALEDNDGGDVYFELVLENDEFSPSKAVSLANKLIYTDKVDVLISSLAYAGMAIKTIADKAQVVHINLGSNENVADGVMNFVVWTPNEESGRKFEKILQKNEVKKLVIFAMNHSGTDPYTTQMELACERNNIEYITYRFNPTEKDFKFMIFKGKEDNPDIFAITALAPSLDVWAKTLNDLMIDIPVTSINCISVSNNKALFEGCEYADIPNGSRNLQERAKAITKTDNFFAVPFAYDSVKMIMDIQNKFYERESRVASREELATLVSNVRGLDGESGNFDMGENGVSQSKAVIKKIVKGEPVLVNQ